MDGKNLSTFGIIIGGIIATSIVGALLRRDQEKWRKEDEQLVKDTTEAVFKGAFPKN